MTSERWRQISDVFHAALGHDGASRQNYLDRACAEDGGLRAEVDALLAAHERAGTFGEKPLFASRAPLRPAPAAAEAQAFVGVGASGSQRFRFVWIVWFAAIVTAAAFSYATWRLIDQGFTLPYVGWNETRHGAVVLVTAVDPSGPAANRVQPGDQIVSLDGVRPTGASMGTRDNRAPLAPGDSYALAVMRGGELVTQRLAVVASRAELPSRVGWFIVSLVWCVVGLFVGFAQPDQPVARLAFASAVATGLVLFQIGVAHGGMLWQPLQIVLWYHFFARFPTGAPLRGGWKIVLSTLYGVGCLVMAIGLSHHAAFLLRGAEGARGIVDRYPLVFFMGGAMSFVVWLGAVVATFFALRRNYRGLSDRDQRRRVRWVMYGASLAVVPMFAALLLVTLPPESSVGVQIDSELVLYAFSLGIPLSVAYVVVKHRVFDIRVVVRRGVQYLLARRALQLFVMLPVVAWIYTLSVNRDRTLADLLTHSTGHLYWIVAAALALRFRGPIQRWLDRKFFREDIDREHMLIGLVDELGRAESISELSELVRAKLEPALHPTSVLVWYRDPGELAVASASNPDLVPPDFPGGGRWIAWLEERGSGADLPLPAAAGLTERESRWLAEKRVALVVPMRDNADRLIGVLLLGGKKSEEPYTSGEAQFLNAVAKQLAVNRENLRLRSRLSEEVRVRRDVLARLDDRLPDLLKECPKCGACFSGAIQTCPADGEPLALSLPIARTIDGRYRLDRLLGKGGMGAVYEARDLRLEREVAVKIMLSRAFGQPGALRRFRREARTAAGLSHRNIVTVYDVGSVEGEGAYIVMERVLGETLRTALERAHKLSPEAAAEWFEPLLEGIAAAHERGIVHRDLKPENVMGHRDASGALAVKILDLGLVKLRTAEPGGSGTMTQEGIVMGTPDYMPPEQLLGREVDHRADLFAVGVMLLETLTGQKTFQHNAQASMSSDCAETSAHSSALHALVRCCLAADPRDRPDSAAALKQRLLPLLKREVPTTV